MLTKSTIKEYPKSYELFVGFVGDQLRNVMKLGIPPEAEFPELQRNFLEATIDGLLVGNPRILFDFFDSNKIFIHIIIQDRAPLSTKFGFDLGESSTFVDGFNNRPEAEEAAFLQAFKILEEK